MNGPRGVPKPVSIVILVLIGIAGIIVISSLGSLVERNKAGQVQVLQSLSGKMSARIEPGWYYQGFAEVTNYKQNVTVGFGDVEGEGSADINAVDVIFNDGSKAAISGIIRVQLPPNEQALVDLKKQYMGGYDHFVQNGVVPVVENAVRLAANLRSAQDAYTTLAVFQEEIYDQLKNGTYKTRSVTKEVTNAAGEQEKVKVTEKVLDEAGNPVRVPHVLQDLGCKVTQCQIKVPQFDKSVEGMIQQRKEQALKTEVAKQEAIRAEQEAKTIAAQGQADATKAKWEQEKLKATAVTEAEQKKEVARLDKEAAEFTKQKLILEGQGEAEKKRLTMQADGALKQKLEAYVAVQEIWAKAFAEGYKVPTVDMGGGQGGTASWDAAMKSITLKQLQDLGLDMNIKK